MDTITAQYCVWLARVGFKDPESSVKSIYLDITNPEYNAFYSWPIDIIKINLLTNNINKDNQELETIKFTTGQMTISKYLLHKYTQYYNPSFANHVSHLTTLNIDEFASNLMINTLSKTNILPFHDTTVTIQQVVEFWQLWYYLGITFEDDEHIITNDPSDPLIAQFQSLSTDDPWYKSIISNKQQHIELNSHIENIDKLVGQIPVLERVGSNDTFTSLLTLKKTLYHTLTQLDHKNLTLLDQHADDDDADDDDDDDDDDSSDDSIDD